MEVCDEIHVRVPSIPVGPDSDIHSIGVCVDPGSVWTLWKSKKVFTLPGNRIPIRRSSGEP
jgi:hypothetical protein